jgi:hypothetical protein
MRLLRTVVVDKALSAVFGYLSDFTTTTEWDPGTVSTVRVSGDGGVGTRYLNTSRFRGRTTELTYVVEERVNGLLIRLRGDNSTLTSVDTMTFRVVAAGTEVTYTADFTFKGVARFVAPLLGPAFKKLGDEAETGMREALNQL